MSCRYRISLIVEDIEEKKLYSLANYFMNIMSRVGIRSMANIETIAYPVQFDAPKCELCNSNEVIKIDPEIEIIDTLLIKIDAEVCENCFYKYSNKDDVSELVNKLISKRDNKWNEDYKKKFSNNPSGIY